MGQYCNLPGVTCPPPEPWTIFACVLILWAMMQSIAGVLVEAYRYRIREMSVGLQMLVAVVFLSYHPYALAFQFGMWMTFYGAAPLGGSIITTLFGLYGMGTFWYFTMGPSFWKSSRS